MILLFKDVGGRERLGEKTERWELTKKVEKSRFGCQAGQREMFEGKQKSFEKRQRSVDVKTGRNNIEYRMREMEKWERRLEEWTEDDC